MNEYEVIITPEAEGDLDQLGAYITFELKAPETAFSYVRDIRTELSTLRKAPKRFRVVDDEPWHSRGLRRMNARNFAAFLSSWNRKARSSFRTLFTRNEIFRRCWRNYIVTLMNYKSL